MKPFAAVLIAATLLSSAAKPTYAADLFPITVGQERRIFEDATAGRFCCRVILHGR